MLIFLVVIDLIINENVSCETFYDDAPFLLLFCSLMPRWLLFFFFFCKYVNIKIILLYWNLKLLTCFTSVDQISCLVLLCFFLFFYFYYKYFFIISFLLQLFCRVFSLTVWSLIKKFHRGCTKLSYSGFACIFLKKFKTCCITDDFI